MVLTYLDVPIGIIISNRMNMLHQFLTRSEIS